MKPTRATYVLIGLFFTGLLLLWGLDRAGFLTEAERNRRADRVLPSLIDVNSDDVRVIEIDRDGERLVFQKLGRRNWRMVEPLAVAADPAALENVFANLKNLRKSPDAGTIQGSAQDFGLDPPAAKARVWVGKAGNPDEPPTASLSLGKTTTGNRYVLAEDGAGVEVVDKRALELIDRPAVAWRETRPVPLSTFEIGGLTIHRPGLNIQAERGAGGQWRLTSPVRFPADGAKVESALAALCSIRIKPAEGGFAAVGVTDFAPFGLDEPVATIELSSSASPGNPLILLVGQSPTDHPDRVYVRRADQDEVALVDGRFLSEIPTDRVGFRGQHVAEVFPPAVDRIEIQAPEGDFEIVRAGEGWELKSPRSGTADPILIEALLGAVDGLQTSEFLDPKHLSDAGLDPPASTLKVWQREPDGRGGIASELVVSLDIGNHDVLKNTVYARIPGDSAILALPDTFLSVLPKTSFAYGDLSLPAVQPERVDELTIARKDLTVVLRPDAEPTTPNQWRMVSPVSARANAQAVATALATLANLRAGEYIADDVGDGARYGLNDPELEIKWRYGNSKPAEAREITTLRVGGAVPGVDTGARYATLSDRPAVFTLDEATLQPFVDEFHDPVVLTFPAGSARRLILRSANHRLAFARREHPTGGPTDWTPEPGTSTQGVDLSRFGDLIKALSQLRTARFAQYEGSIPESVGLAEPRLVVEVEFDDDDQPSRAVRLGTTTGNGWIYATLGDGTTGAVFLMPAAAWEAMIPEVDESLPPLPENVFAPD